MSSPTSAAGTVSDNIWDFSQSWHIPIIVIATLLFVAIGALLIISFFTIHKMRNLSEELQEMDQTFLKTLSERDRNMLEQCVRLSYQQSKEHVSKLWAIYVLKEEMVKENEREKRTKENQKSDAKVAESADKMEKAKPSTSSNTVEGKQKTA